MFSDTNLTKWYLYLLATVELVPMYFNAQIDAYTKHIWLSIFKTIDPCIPKNARNQIIFIIGSPDDEWKFLHVECDDLIFDLQLIKKNLFPFITIFCLS